MNNLDQARKWADRRRNISDSQLNAGVKAAAEVIQSLPDRWIDAEKLRKVVDDLHPELKGGDIEQALRHLLPTTSLPTLAELIEAGNEPEDYQWMRAKDSNGEDLYLTRIMEVTSEVVYRDGMTVIDINSEFTPLPDLPKLEWPAQEPQPVVNALHTVGDYEAAAIGTVVRRQEIPWLAATFHKCVDGIWNSTVAHEYPSSEMAGTARTVLWEPKP